METLDYSEFFDMPEIQGQEIEQNAPDLIEIIKDYVSLDNEIKELDAHLRHLKRVREAKKEHVITGMQAAGVPSLSVLGKTVTPKIMVQCSIRDGMASEAHEWLINNGYSDLLEVKVNKKSLTPPLRELIESEGLDSVPQDIFNVAFIESVGLRKKS